MLSDTTLSPVQRALLAPPMTANEVQEMRKLRRKGWTITSLEKRYSRTPAEVKNALGPDF
ncbi:hypothetical protein [Hyphomicrobium sp.]|uniref:hypothetical protein n=1 Tax=Hyphomicrobium sp. TaxID=82 RepID=UPI001D4BA66E|nr:hypothetical protein [Hyphomicrobium sp.]MBY0561471.1 hypothetical protein [Hyphomicrobium sp.]